MENHPPRSKLNDSLNGLIVRVGSGFAWSRLGFYPNYCLCLASSSLLFLSLSSLLSPFHKRGSSCQRQSSWWCRLWVWPNLLLLLLNPCDRAWQRGLLPQATIVLTALAFAVVDSPSFSLSLYTS